MASLLGWWSRGEEDYGVDFWSSPERAGWLMKQGEHIKTWRRRWFVLKRGKLFWFKDSQVTRASRPRGVIPVSTCLTVKGAEDALNKPFAFEISTRTDVMYFIADSEKEKEDWINSIGDPSSSTPALSPTPRSSTTIPSAAPMPSRPTHPMISPKAQFSISPVNLPKNLRQAAVLAWMDFISRFFPPFL